MVTEGSRKARPSLDFRHYLLTEDEPAHCVAQALYLAWVGRSTKLICQIEESLLFRLLRFQTLLEQFHQHAIVTEPLLPGNSFYLLRQSTGKSHTSPDVFRIFHVTILHQNGARPNSPSPARCTTLPRTEETMVSRCRVPAVRQETGFQQTDSAPDLPPSSRPSFAPDRSPSRPRVPHIPARNTSRPSVQRAA